MSNTARSRGSAPRKKTKVGPIELVNIGTTPVVYSVDGHTLGGGERRECPEIDRVARHALEHGYLRAQRDDEWLIMVEGELVPENPATDEDETTPEQDAPPLPEPESAPVGASTDDRPGAGG